MLGDLVSHLLWLQALWVRTGGLETGTAGAAEETVTSSSAYEGGLKECVWSVRGSVDECGVWRLGWGGVINPANQPIMSLLCRVNRRICSWLHLILKPIIPTWLINWHTHTHTHKHVPPFLVNDHKCPHRLTDPKQHIFHCTRTCTCVWNTLTHTLGSEEGPRVHRKHHPSEDLLPLTQTWTAAFYIDCDKPCVFTHSHTHTKTWTLKDMSDVIVPPVALSDEGLTW